MFRVIYQHKELHVERQKGSNEVDSSHNSRSFSAKLD